MYNKKSIKLILILIALLFTNFAFAQSNRDKQIAKYLFEFGRYLRWENDDEIEVIKIGVLGESQAFINELKRITKKGYDEVIMFEIIEFKTPADIKETHMLFIPKSFNDQITSITKKIKGYNTALITEEYDVKKEIMINFYKRGDNYTFEINPEILKTASINVMDEISKLKGTKITTKEIIDESEKNLEEEKKKVKNQQGLIKKQQDQLDLQKSNIEKQEKELDAQKKLLLTQADDIVKQVNRIKTQKNELVKLENDAKNTKIELDLKIKDLREKEESIQAKEKVIDENTKILDDQKKRLSEGQTRINQMNIEIASQSGTIIIYKNIVLIISGFLAIFLGMLFFILRSYWIKKKDNKLLAEQKKEIQNQAFELEIINKELEKLSLIASETSNAIAILSTNGIFEWVNVGFTKLYGYTLETLKEKLGENLRNASNNVEIESLLNNCINEKKSIIYEAFITTLPGEEKWAQSTMTPILDINGEVSKIILIDSDITKIKEFENEILKQHEKISAQASELEKKNSELEKLSLVASKTDNSVIIANADGEIEWVNDGFTRMLGMTYEEFSNEYGHNLFKTSLNPRLREQLQGAIKEKRSIIYSTKTATRDGRVIWIQTTMTPIFAANGDLSRYIAIDAEITKIKLAEEEISRQKQKITDSIFYAKKIQEAVLPPDDYLKQLFPDNFILFKPKDIVSGDFYWTTHKGDKFLIAAADCTGHGVPGGFMSMLGMTFLNEIVGQLREEDISAGKILTMLRQSVKKSLRQTGKEGEAKDGMDISLCVIDRKTLQMQFSGANNPLLIIRDYGEEIEVINVKPDEMPIGIYFNEKLQFTNHKIQLQKGDLCYLYSDGYADQFGGKTGRKFMSKRFKNMLAAHCDKSLKNQKVVIENAFEKWKGENRQIDDVLVIGIRI